MSDNGKQDVPVPREGRPEAPAKPVVSAAGNEDLILEGELPLGEEPSGLSADPGERLTLLHNRGGRPRRGRLEMRPDLKQGHLTVHQRLLILDTWMKSGLTTTDFSSIVGLSYQTLRDWKRKFDREGPAGLEDKPREKKGGPINEAVRRTILMLKQAHAEWGCQRISDVMERSEAISASPTTVSKVLHEAGYETVEAATSPHGVEPRRFERAAANQLWQTDLFTFTLKRQNRRVYLVAFMDDHSRYIVCYGLFAAATATSVVEVLRAGIVSYGRPDEVLTDNGPQYVTWRGKSLFAKELDRQGVRQIVATPRRPQTLGKIERFWGTLWEECVAAAIFIDMEDARRRIGHYIDHYNFQRPHQGINGLVPADRFFDAARQVQASLEDRVAKNALEMAKNGIPRKPFYLTGQAGGQAFSVHAEGERVFLKKGDGAREEVELVGPPPSEPAAEMPEPVCPRGLEEQGPVNLEHEEPPAAGASPLDEGLKKLDEGLSDPKGGVQ